MDSHPPNIVVLYSMCILLILTLNEFALHLLSVVESGWKSSEATLPSLTTKILPDQANPKGAIIYLCVWAVDARGVGRRAMQSAIHPLRAPTHRMTIQLLPPMRIYTPRAPAMSPTAHPLATPASEHIELSPDSDVSVS